VPQAHASHVCKGGAGGTWGLLKGVVETWPKLVLWITSANCAEHATLRRVATNEPAVAMALLPAAAAPLSCALSLL